MSFARALAAAALVALSLPAAAVEDLRALAVQGQRGQSAEQTRRDRYECHNWAVDESGELPPVVSAAADERYADRELRRERVDRAIAGAAIGGFLGSLFGHGRHHRHSGDRVLAGAAAGAAIGAVSARGSREEEAPESEPSEYLRALTACLEGRGYSVSMPAGAAR